MNLLLILLLIFLFFLIVGLVIWIIALAGRSSKCPSGPTGQCPQCPSCPTGPTGQCPQCPTGPTGTCPTGPTGQCPQCPTGPTGTCPTGCTAQCPPPVNCSNGTLGPYYITVASNQNGYLSVGNVNDGNPILGSTGQNPPNVDVFITNNQNSPYQQWYLVPNGTNQYYLQNVAINNYIATLFSGDYDAPLTLGSIGNGILFILNGPATGSNSVWLTYYVNSFQINILSLSDETTPLSNNNGTQNLYENISVIITYRSGQVGNYNPYTITPPNNQQWILTPA